MGSISNVKTRKVRPNKKYIIWLTYNLKISSIIFEYVYYRWGFSRNFLRMKVVIVKKHGPKHILQFILNKCLSIVL